MYAAVLGVVDWNKLSIALCVGTGPELRVVEIRSLSKLLKIWDRTAIKEALARVVRSEKGNFTRIRLKRMAKERDWTKADAYLCFRIEPVQHPRNISVKRMLFCDLAAHSDYRVTDLLGLDKLFKTKQGWIRLGSLVRPRGTLALSRVGPDSLSDYVSRALKLNCSKTTLCTREMYKLSKLILEADTKRKLAN